MICFNLGHSRKSKGAYNPYATQFTPYKGNRIPESEKLLLLESGILGFGIQNPSSTDRLESNIWNPEFAAWNPESKTVLDSLTWGDTIIFSLETSKVIF